MWTKSARSSPTWEAGIHTSGLKESGNAELGMQVIACISEDAELAFATLPQEEIKFAIPIKIHDKGGTTAQLHVDGFAVGFDPEGWLKLGCGPTQAGRRESGKG